MAKVSIVRTLEYVTIAALLAFAAIAESGEWTTHESGSRNIDVGIAACTFRAVAAEEMDACRHPVVAWLVRQIAASASLTKTGRKKLLADGDSVWIMASIASGSEGTGT